MVEKIFVKQAREKAGLTQGEVSKYMGYSNPQFISNWERGLSCMPLKAMSKFCAVTGADPKKLAQVKIEQFKNNVMAWV